MPPGSAAEQLTASVVGRSNSETLDNTVVSISLTVSNGAVDKTEDTGGSLENDSGNPPSPPKEELAGTVPGTTEEEAG